MAKYPLPLVFALDEKWETCGIWVDRLESKIWGFKVGSILFSEKGPWVIDYLKSKGLKVFLDLKFHDIPNTVSNSVSEVFKQGVDWVTVHTAGGREMLEAAAEHQNENQRIVGVTVLTSHDEKSFKEIGMSGGIDESVQNLVRLGVSAGVTSFVCSPLELKKLRLHSPEIKLITPGVRLEAATGDQKRVANFRDALDWGASTIVLGRELRNSKDWEKTWESISSSMDGMY